MTIEQAHKILENLQRRYTHFRYDYGDDVVEANGLAIIAVEKQIPKHVDYVRWGNDAPKEMRGRILACLCPNCRGTLANDDYCFKSDYCSMCGQALNWNERRVQNDV